jgi:rare lipoprotein A
MRTLFVICAVALGMGCDASATEQGLASFYGAQGLTAAHRSLPMGSRVKVLNLDNGRSVIVRIVDRGSCPSRKRPSSSLSELHGKLGDGVRKAA